MTIEVDIAKRIAEWPCRSLREISLKIDYAENDLDVRDGLAAVAILQSIKHFIAAPALDQT